METDVFDGIVAMCSKMHKTVSIKSTQYLEEMRRHNYVTPTSYLELISMIKMVLELRQKAVRQKRSSPSPPPLPIPCPYPYPNLRHHPQTDPCPLPHPRPLTLTR